MIDLALATSAPRRSARPASRQQEMVAHLRAMVLSDRNETERFHAIFLGHDRIKLGDAPIGQGGTNCLSLRMRELFEIALSLQARSILIAHNHPSGQCWPSQGDINATDRLKGVALALDIELIDHLIITREAVYSMRAGGKL